MKRLLPAATAAATAFLVHAQVAIAASGSATKGEESKPLNLPLDKVNESSSAPGTSSGSLGRTLFGLFVVILVIYALYWILKQVKKSREEQAHGQGLHSLASLPLGPNRSLHMIRAGREIVLVGVAEHGVSPIRSYTEDEALEAGLIGTADDDDSTGGSVGTGGKPGKPGFASPGQAIGTALESLRNRTVRK
jgi:flagellar protein FliO/FliZ